ncbi:MAG: ester cyclase [Acidobacteriota bacterium]
MTQNTIPQIRRFAEDYTAAWCSKNAASVAAFFTANGSSQDNGGPLHTGREAITKSVQSFMSAFPDMLLSLEEVREEGSKVIYVWKLDGTHAETGRHVSIIGSEAWMLSDDGLIASSVGSFDEEDYRRQAGL